MSVNEIEREAIILDTAWGMIDDMINWSVFQKHDGTDNVSMSFRRDGDSRLFAVLLGDFLSAVGAYGAAPPLGLLTPPSNAQGADRAFLFHLRQVCNGPRLGANTFELRTSVEAFGTWIEKDFVVEKVHLSAIGVEADLRITRHLYIKMCGDIGKHNVTRLAGNVKRLRRLFEDAGRPISEKDTYLGFADFYQWFMDYVLGYHVGQISELLNNIRWAMFGYLQPEHLRSKYHPEGMPDYAYAYRYPANCTDPLARAMYWNLMNRARQEPYMQRFTSDELLKRRY